MSASGPFATAALQLHSYGLAPIPCSANDDGKVPGIATKHWKRRLGAGALNQLVFRFREQNIGILTGFSRVSVVDIDDARLVGDMICRFGSTPLAVETPSGGIHLYYRSSGERCANLRKSDGVAVDIKAIGGFVVVPPSVRPSGAHAGKPYRFLEGSWDDVARLPVLKPGSLPAPATALPSVPQRDPRPDAIPTGVRNDTLFRRALREAGACDDLDALLDKVRLFNESCDPPLPDAEVARTCRSAWRYHTEGRNLTGGPRKVFNLVSEVEAFQRVPNGADALMLLSVLRMTHFGGRPFAVSPQAMARDGVMVGWSVHRYRDARALLIDLGTIAMVHPGGRGKRDPAMFCLLGDMPARPH